MLYVKDLHKSYEVGKTKYPVLKGIDFHVARGEFVAVMGPSGSGKTTLLNCISCYIRENVLVPRIVQGEVGQDAEQLADKLASMFGIGHILNKYPAEISGGEKQRTAVARSLINNPLIILADEPTGNLDSKSSRTVIESFVNAKTQMNATVFMVTHDSFAASFCDRVILIKDGDIYRQLEKRGDRSEFQDELLDVIKEMSVG